MKKQIIFDKAFTTTIIIAVIVNIGVSVIIPVIPNIMRFYGLNVEFITAAFVFLFLGRVLSSIITGRLLNKIDVVTILFSVFFLHFTTMILLAHAQSAWQFIVLRFFEGIFEGVLTVLLQYMVIALSSPSDRGVKMGYLGSSFGLGFILGPLFGSIAQQWFDYSGVFYLTALLMLAGILWLSIFRNNLVEKIKPNKDINKNNSFSILNREHFKYLSLYGGAILQRSLVVAFAVLLPFYLVDKFYLQEYMVGYFFTGSALLTTFLMPHTGKLFGISKFQGIAVFIAITVMSLSIFGMGLVNDISVFIGLFILETLAFSVMSPNAMSIFGNAIQSHEQKSQIIGTYTSIREISSIFIALLILPVYSYSESSAWTILSILTFMASLPYLKWSKTAIQIS